MARGSHHVELRRMAYEANVREGRERGGPGPSVCWRLVVGRDGPDVERIDFADRISAELRFHREMRLKRGSGACGSRSSSTGRGQRAGRSRRRPGRCSVPGRPRRPEVGLDRVETRGATARFHRRCAPAARQTRGVGRGPRGAAALGGVVVRGEPPPDLVDFRDCAGDVVAAPRGPLLEQSLGEIPDQPRPALHVEPLRRI
jgi:hypothetical protein